MRPVITVISVVVGLLVAVPTASASTVVRSKFETSAEGWKQAVAQYGSPQPARWTADYGFPPAGGQGALLANVTTSNPHYFYWNAPAKFLGNQVAAYKGRLEFDQYYTSPTSNTNARNVLIYVLDKNGAQLLFTLTAAQDDVPAFSHHVVPLTKTGWKMYPSMTPASGEKLEHALRHLAELDIETFDNVGGCQGVGNEFCAYLLDNVVLKTP